MTIPLSASRMHLACAAIAALVLHSCSPEPVCAATPLQLRWTAELSEPKPYQAVLFAGEAADLQATLKLYGRSIVLEDSATASLYWQTNGMASAWWSVPATVTTAGVVTASWTPAMDAGADLYRWHIGVANAASSTIYRAFGAFRMQPSPGAAPNILDLPTRWIDFDSVAISNAPWATPADVAEATEGMLTTEADPVAGAAISAHAGRTDNPHGVTAAQIGALTSETDSVALPVALGVSNALASTTLRSLATTDDRVDSLRILAGPASTNLADGSFTFGGDGFFPEDTELAYRSDLVGWDVWSSETLGTQRLYLWQGKDGDYTVSDAVGVEIPEGLAIDTWRLWRTSSGGYFYIEECGTGPLPVHGLYGFDWISAPPYYVPVATSNWVESIRGVHADIATNVVYHVVVSNGHWLIREVQ